MPLYRLFPALLLLLATTTFAAESAPPEFRGVLSAGGARRFALAVPGGMQAWVGVGESFEGWVLADYDPVSDTLTLRKDGRQISLGLSVSVLGTNTSVVGTNSTASAGTKATLADAEEVLGKMRFEEMMGKVLEQQKKSAATLVKQMAAQAGADTSDESTAFQARLLDTMFAELNADVLRGDIARAYSEIFTKEELQSLASFYASPAGQAMVEKQPELAQKMSDLMTPRIMAALPKAQQLAKDFAATQAAKKNAPTATK